MRDQSQDTPLRIVEDLPYHHDREFWGSSDESRLQETFARCLDMYASRLEETADWSTVRETYDRLLEANEQSADPSYRLDVTDVAAAAHDAVTDSISDTYGHDHPYSGSQNCI